MEIIDTILSRNEFEEKPPLLIDIGASEGIHGKWKDIAKYSICIAFDADQRDFSFTTKESAGFRKLISYNCIVTEHQLGEADFYLTKSPYCSSLLKPDDEALDIWAFSEKFKVVKTEKIKTRSLSEVLTEQNINYVDWFKTDSQGTDLRLFKSLGEQIYKNILAVELEPGIIDSYSEEDKLYSILNFMNDNNFLLSEMVTKGSQRISTGTLEKITKNKFLQKLVTFSHRSSPGWAELLYLNKEVEGSGIREHLLAWIFAVLQKQYGYAFEIADSGESKFRDEIFTRMKEKSVSLINRNVFKLRFFPSFIGKIKNSM
jgi:hypothetical protein